jgi:hypothetical protein
VSERGAVGMTAAVYCEHWDRRKVRYRSKAKAKRALKLMNGGARMGPVRALLGLRNRAG